MKRLLISFRYGQHVLPLERGTLSSLRQRLLDNEAAHLIEPCEPSRTNGRSSERNIRGEAGRQISMVRDRPRPRDQTGHGHG